ncbi:unnamed protein product, partial [Protopolystoma xenopodis]
MLPRSDDVRHMTDERRFRRKQRHHECFSKANRQLVKRNLPSSSGGIEFRISSADTFTRNGRFMMSMIKMSLSLENGQHWDKELRRLRLPLTSASGQQFYPVTEAILQASDLRINDQPLPLLLPKKFQEKVNEGSCESLNHAYGLNPPCIAVVSSQTHVGPIGNQLSSINVKHAEFQSQPSHLSCNRPNNIDQVTDELAKRMITPLKVGSQNEREAGIMLDEIFRRPVSVGS